MSVDEKLLRDTRQEIATIVVRRKRKLIELFRAASWGSGPQNQNLDPQLDVQRDEPPAAFLDQYDIEKGFYIQDSTLPVYCPPRIQHASVVAPPPFDFRDAEPSHGSVQTAIATESYTSEHSVDTSPFASEIGPAKIGDTKSLHEDDMACLKNTRQLTATQNQEIRGDARENVERFGISVRLSGAVVEQDSTHRQIKHHGLALVTDQSKVRMLPGRTSQLESPPYSPVVDSNRSASASVEDIAAFQGPAELANTPNSREDGHGVGASRQTSLRDDHVEEFAAMGRISADEQLPPPNPMTSNEELAISLVASATQNPITSTTDSAQPPIASSGSQLSQPQPRRSLSKSPGGLKQTTEQPHGTMDYVSSIQSEKIHQPDESLTLRNDLSGTKTFENAQVFGHDDTALTKLTTSETVLRPAKARRLSSQKDTSQSPAQQQVRSQTANAAGLSRSLQIASAEDVPGRSPLTADPVFWEIRKYSRQRQDLPLQHNAPTSVPASILKESCHEGDVDNLTSVRPSDVSMWRTASVSPSRESNSARICKAKTKRRGRQSAVVLSKQPDNRYYEMMRALRRHQPKPHGKATPFQKHYMQLSFLHQAVQSTYSSNLTNLLRHSAKTLTTSDWMLDFREQHECRVLSRIRYLQNENRWSLRQITPSPEPPPSRSHLDLLLKDVKWLQTDFREERKLRISVARVLAEWCAEWVLSDPRERSSLRITVKIAERFQRLGSYDIPARQADPASFDQIILRQSSIAGIDLADTTNKPAELADPVAVFNAAPNAVFLNVDRNLIGEGLLSRLPLFGSDDAITPNSAPFLERPNHGVVSQAVTETLRRGMIPSSPTEQDETWSEESDKPPLGLPPEDNTCALFDPESRPLRARLNAYWAFRPPTGSMPSQSFYEARTASQWTWEDDQQLRGLVKEFPSNWGLISDKMSPKTLFPSTIQRRTPWECYERLLGMEGTPADASTRQYLRHFHARLDQARNRYQTNQAAAQQQAQHHAQATGQPIPTFANKRFPSPIRVERKVDRRFLAMLDAARKLARKRETKQQQQLQSNEVNRPAIRVNPSRTPQYFSHLKHEREKDERRRQELFRHQQRIYEAQQRQQRGHQTLLASGIAQQMHNGLAAGVTGSSSANGNLAVPMPNQPRPPSQNPALQIGMQNGLPSNAQMGANGRPQANMQGNQRLAPPFGAASPVNTENMQRLMQQAQQHRAIQQFQGQRPPSNPMQQTYGRGSPNTTNVNGVSNPGMLAQFNNHLISTPGPMHSPGVPQTMPNGVASYESPHLTQQLLASSTGTSQMTNVGTTQPQSLSNGTIPAVNYLQHQIRASHPQLSQDEVRHRAGEQLKDAYAQSRRNALNAAAGIHGASSVQQQQQQQPPSSSPFLQHQQQLPDNASPFQLNGMLHPQGGGGSGSPHQKRHGNGAPAMQQQLQQQMTQQQYQQQLRAQMLQQRQMGMAAGAARVGSPNGVQHSTSLAMDGATPAVNGNMGMRPPSRNGHGGAMGSPSDQRPGTAGGMQAQSPRLGMGT